jgi:NitT/TauT family transport system ATP-binding protein
MGAKQPLLEARHVTVQFDMPNNTKITVVEDLNFVLHEGEFVALLGSSGSGKSTFLRCLSGLIKPTKGQILYRGEEIKGVNPNISMVFQSAALFPWLTVLDNVTIGLKSQGVSQKEAEKRSIAGIDLVGLDGFETAYPKELSGGMRQRVGFARAIVVEPEILFLDEPFSGLDILTAENLRTDLLDLWIDEKIPIKAMLLVTHSIEEAMMLADRIIILGKNPGRIVEEISVNIPHWRDKDHPDFAKLLDSIYGSMMGRKSAKTGQPMKVEIKTEIPVIREGSLSGFVEYVFDLEEKMDIYKVAADLQMNVDQIQPLIETGELLGFLDAKEGDIYTTEIGKKYAEADLLNKKEIYREMILQKIPFIHMMAEMLMQSPNQRSDYQDFLDILLKKFSQETAEEQLDSAIDMGRYAELFGYDEDTKQLFLEETVTFEEK